MASVKMDARTIRKINSITGGRSAFAVEGLIMDVKGNLLRNHATVGVEDSLIALILSRVLFAHRNVPRGNVVVDRCLDHDLNSVRGREELDVVLKVADVVCESVHGGGGKRGERGEAPTMLLSPLVNAPDAPQSCEDTAEFSCLRLW